MASSMDKLELIYQKFEREKQGGEDGLGTIFQYLEMAVYIYVKQNEDDGDKEEGEAIFDEKRTLIGEGKKRRSLRSGKTAQKEKNKMEKGHYVKKQQKGGKQNKREVGRQGVKEDKEKKKQGRKDGGEQDIKKQKFFRDNG